MRDFMGKVAVVTGGASGIGRAMALSLAREGMNVAIADVEDAPSASVRRELEELGVKAVAMHADVSDRQAMERFADDVFSAFGAAHVLCNNAGVGVGGATYVADERDWRWVLGVNLEGVIHGCQAFVPRLIEQGQGGHVVNTASMAGMVASPELGPYTTTKFAVVGLSESLRLELAPYDIGVSVLCPGFVRTLISESERNRPPYLSAVREAEEAQKELMRALVDSGIEPSAVGARVVRALREGAFYIFTHPEMRFAVEARFEEILRAFDYAETLERGE